MESARLVAAYCYIHDLRIFFRIPTDYFMKQRIIDGGCQACFIIVDSIIQLMAINPPLPVPGTTWHEPDPTRARRNRSGPDLDARFSFWRERGENAINGATNVYPVC